MRLLAFAPALDSDAIVKVELDNDGTLVVTLETEDATETHTLAATAVSAELRALASSSREAAA